MLRKDMLAVSSLAHDIWSQVDDPSNQLLAILLDKTRLPYPSIRLAGGHKFLELL